MIYELKDPSKAEALFAGMDDSMIRSCLEGMMDSKIYVTDPEEPRSAMAYLAAFAFLAGEPDRELASFKPKGIVGLVPPEGRWTELVAEAWPYVTPDTRYAIRKDTKFDRKKLEAIAATLPEGYELRRFDGDLYDACLENNLFEDNVGSFASKEEFLKLGRGFAVLKDGKIVSAASSYTVYREGIEIEIDTAEEHRRKGLASACGAALILSCLDDGLYPSWDAANLWSVHLAEKLGYVFSHEYVTYWLGEVFDRVIGDPDRSEWDSFCGRYRHPKDARRIYGIRRQGDDLFYHFVSPEEGKPFDTKMYPVGERTFGICEDDFELVFRDGKLIIGGVTCERI